MAVMQAFWGSRDLRVQDLLWVLGFMQERFHSSSPGGIQSTLIKAGVGETKAGLTIEETRL